MSLNDYVYCDIDNPFGDDGVKDIVEALKVNITLVGIGLEGGKYFCFVFV